MTLGGKVAIVTGGGSGLGREIALAYAEAGAVVVVASNAPAENAAVASACAGLGATACALELDVRDEAAVRTAFASVLERHGGLDVVVAAAGLDVRRSVAREERFVAAANLDDWQTVIGVNLTGTFLCVREAVGHMLPRAAGSIITFTSGTVRQPQPGIGAYVASKAGIEGLTSVTALELEGTGVRANLLQPGGMTDTAFFPPWTTEAERARMHSPKVIRACAVWLASDESAGTNGAELVAADWNRERGLTLCPCPACSA